MRQRERRLGKRLAREFLARWLPDRVEFGREIYLLLLRSGEGVTEGVHATFYHELRSHTDAYEALWLETWDNGCFAKITVVRKVQP